MSIFIASLAGFKNGVRKPEVWTFLFLSENYREARKAAVVAAKGRFPTASGYVYINVVVAKQDRAEIEEMLKEPNSSELKDWQSAIGYKNGKALIS
jgi:hypothetical protein